MPVYAYQCDECGVRFERRQSFSDAPINVCPECEGKVHRLIQPAGVIFKGSGFYSTDHRGGSRKSGESKTSKSDGESKSEVKSETKSAEASKPAAASAD
jgi:putative FmdB family regulatory protein